MYRFSVISFAVLTLASTLASDAFAAGDYQKSCSNSRIVDLGANKILVAECTRKDGSVNLFANLVLNAFIANDDGSLSWRESGGFGASCSDPSLVGSRLDVTCRKRDGSNVSASINLGERIANLDGALKYVGP